MRRIIAILVALLTCLVSVAYAEELPTDIATILHNGVLRIGVVANDAPPFSTSSSNGTLSGYDIDMVTDMAQRLGVKATFITAATFDDLISLINNHKVDVATNITPTLARAESTLFSRPYAAPKLVFFVNRLAFSRQRLTPRNLSQLNDPTYKIGVLQRSAYYTVLKDLYPKATVIPYRDVHEAIEGVMNDKLIAVFLDQPHIHQWLSDHQQANLYGAVIDSGKKLPTTLAVSWGNTQLLVWINTYLDIIAMDDSQTRWIKKYFPENM